MRPPAFWFTPPDRPGLCARLLSPLGRLFAMVRMWPHRRGDPVEVEVPVIRIDTLMGGATIDTTPTVIALVQHLQAAGRRVYVISGALGTGPASTREVDPRVDAAVDVGDDALLIAAFTRVWRTGDPSAAARAAVQAGAQVIIVDGTVGRVVAARALSVIVVDAVRGFGNGRCRPAGPLRTPVVMGLGRADLILSIGSAKAQVAFERVWGHAIRVPRLRGHLAPLQTGMDWSGTPFLAFAGIDAPETFFAMLRGLGARLARAEALEDHQALTPVLMARLEAEAVRQGAQLVTTERDAVRLPPDFRQKVLTLPMRLQIEDMAALDTALAPLQRKLEDGTGRAG